MKRTILILTMLACIGWNQMSVKAQIVIDQGVSGNLTWVLTDDSTLTFSGSGTMENYDPYYYHYSPWYTYQTSIVRVTIGNGATNIADAAFVGCSRLISITIPNSVTIIGNYAFRNCSSLTSVIIPNSVKTIGTGAFEDCSSLTSVTIPNGITSIGSFAFENCSRLKTVNFNTDSCISVGSSCWRNCDSLTTVNIGNNVKRIPDIAFDYCHGLTSITIPNSVKIIGDYAFRDCHNLRTIHFNADSCISVGSSCWRNCDSLTTVNIGNNVKRIPDNAFRNCSGLTSITIPNSVKTIGDYAFDYCDGLTSVTINSVISIGKYAFCGCDGLTSITIPDSVKTIGDRAFYFCRGLTSITIGHGVISIGNDAFYGCSDLISINVDVNNTQYSSIDGVLYNKLQDMLIQCPTKKTGIVAIPNSVINIENNAFMDCSDLTFVAIPNSVINIKHAAFRGCSGLASVTISSVKTIGDYAFAYCSSLTEIINLNPTPITINPVVFSMVDIASCTLKVLSASLPLYQQKAVWKDFLLERYYTVNATANDTAYGTTHGSDFYPANVDVSLSARPYMGYKFVNWTSNGVILSTSNPFTFTVTQDTNIVANFSNDVSIENIQGNSNELILYPNPAQHTLYIQSSEAIEQVVIYDISGRMLTSTVIARSTARDEQHDVAIHNGNAQSIDISNFANGIYIIKVKTSIGETVKKVVIND